MLNAFIVETSISMQHIEEPRLTEDQEYDADFAPFNITTGNRVSKCG